MKLRDLTLVLSTMTDTQRAAYDDMVMCYEEAIKRGSEREKELSQKAFDERMKCVEQEDTCKTIAQCSADAALAIAMIGLARGRQCPPAAWALGILAGGAIGYRFANYASLRYHAEGLIRAIRHRKTRKRQEMQEFIDSVKNNQPGEKTG